MRRKEPPIKPHPLWKKPDKFKFGDKVRYTGNAAMRVSHMEGIVVEHSNITCPMSCVLFPDGSTGYIADSEIELIEELKNGT